MQLCPQSGDRREPPARGLEPPGNSLTAAVANGARAFLAVLWSKEVPVDIASTAALSRGWNYTRYVARMAQDLHPNHAEPAGA